MTPPDNATIANHLRAILSRDEFRTDVSHQAMDWLRARAEALVKALASLSALESTLLVILCLATLFGLAALSLAAYGAVRDEQRRTQLTGMASSAATPPLTAQACLARADALAAAGQLRDAARALQQAVLLHLCAVRQMGWRNHLADWEWLAILAPPAIVVELTAAAQRLAWGPTPAAEDYARCAQQAAAWLERPSSRPDRSS